MKIAIISTSCYRKTGGVAQGTWQAALEYVKAGHEVHIITLMDYLDDYQFPISDIMIHRIKIYHLSIYEYKKMDEEFSIINKLLTIFKLGAYFIKIISIIRNIDPDVIQTKGIMDAIPAYVTKQLFQIPYTLTIHGNPWKVSFDMQVYIQRICWELTRVFPSHFLSRAW